MQLVHFTLSVLVVQMQGHTHWDYAHKLWQVCVRGLDDRLHKCYLSARVRTGSVWEPEWSDGRVWEPVILRGRLSSCYQRIRLCCNPNLTLLFPSPKHTPRIYTHFLRHSVKPAGLRVFVTAVSTVRLGRMLISITFALKLIFFLLISCCRYFFPPWAEVGHRI